MKVLLINPFYASENYYGSISKLRFVFPPVGLLSIAAYIRERGIDVSVYDFETSDKDLKEILEEYQPDAIGMTCQTALVKNTLRLSKELKAINPDVPIIVGGWHCTYRPQDLLEPGDIDFAVVGEGELTFMELVDALDKGKSTDNIKGTVRRAQDGEIIWAAERELMENLDDLPIMAIDLMPVDKYHTSPDLMLGQRVALISMSRGCPAKCTFCAIKHGFNFTSRHRTMESVFKEIDYYRDNYNIDSLFIMDDLFTVDKKRVHAFCDEMIRRGYNKDLKWWCQTRVDCVDEPILRKMKEGGCGILSYGLESGSQRLINHIKKYTKIERTRKVVKLSKKVGLHVRSGFILGLPTETFWESLQTIWLSLTLPLDRTKFSLATPYPGTELWDVAEEEGQINIPEDWDRFTQMAAWTQYKPPYIGKGRTANELKYLQLFANTIFYLQPRIMIQMTLHFYKLQLMPVFLDTAKTYFKALFSRNPAPPSPLTSSLTRERL